MAAQARPELGKSRHRRQTYARLFGRKTSLLSLLVIELQHTPVQMTYPRYFHRSISFVLSHSGSSKGVVLTTIYLSSVPSLLTLSGSSQGSSLTTTPHGMFKGHPNAQCCVHCWTRKQGFAKWNNTAHSLENSRVKSGLSDHRHTAEAVQPNFCMHISRCGFVTEAF
eukprot:1161555-Pelagomonas_calceolata.AAC.8